jgi:hypothetical protein
LGIQTFFSLYGNISFSDSSLLSPKERRVVRDAIIEFKKKEMEQGQGTMGSSSASSISSVPKGYSGKARIH